MSRTGFQYALEALGAVAANFDKAQPGVVQSIHAGLAAAAQTGRELSDLEQLALDNLMGQLVPAVEQEAPVVEAEAEKLAGEAEQEVHQGAEEVAHETESSGEGSPGPAGEGNTSQGLVTQPEAASAEPAEPLTEVHPDPLSAAHLFGNFADEDDGA